MLLVSAFAIACLLTSIDAYVLASTSGTDKLAAQGLRNLFQYELTHQTQQKCKAETGNVRKEWSTLTDAEKTSYIDAVLCLMSKPSISGNLAPGAKSRYDDFVATHINRTMDIHATVSLYH